VYFRAGTGGEPLPSRCWQQKALNNKHTERSSPMTNLTRSLTATAAVATLAISALSTPASAAKPKWAEKSDATIVEFAVGASGTPGDFDANGEDFDILVAALIATGVVGIFDGTDYTVFAPTDQAFYDLTGADNDTDAFNAVVSLLGVTGVADVLAYHVAEGVRNSRSVIGARQITMLDGNSISYDSGSGLIIANQSAAGLVNIDNRLADGMAHIIDTVLLP
jgi:uncharacterized surface protein with fasciclin (FAS1) repeats